MRWNRALVTGASSGIGAAFSLLLAAEGVPVVAVARREQQLRKLPGDVEVLVADLASLDGIEAVESRLTRGDVSLLVNNAGFGTMGRFAEIDAARVADEVTVNVTAVTRLTRAILPSLIAQGSGGVLNVSSLATYQPTPGMNIHGSSKTYVKCFTEMLSQELRGTGVHATVLCPGLTRTKWGEVAGVEGLDRAPAFLWKTAAAVARAGLDAVELGRTLIVPGALNRTVAGLMSVIPRPLMLRVSGAAQRRGAAT